jgi:hypothetical protein
MKSQEEILESYKNLLCEYDEWLCMIKKRYNYAEKAAINPLELDNGEWGAIKIWFARLNVIEKVLGLSPEEVKKYEEEIFTKD